jgi:hypothetical protein
MTPFSGCCPTTLTQNLVGILSLFRVLLYVTCTRYSIKLIHNYPATVCVRGILSLLILPKSPLNVKLKVLTSKATNIYILVRTYSDHYNASKNPQIC